MRQREGYGMRLRLMVGERNDKVSRERERKSVKGMAGKRHKKSQACFLLHFISHNPRPIFESILSPPPLFLLSTLISFLLCSLSSPPPSVCYEQELGRKYVGFSHSLAGPDPTPHPLIFCPSPPLVSASCQRGVLRKTTHIPPLNFWLFVGTLCCLLFH